MPQIFLLHWQNLKIEHFIILNEVFKNYFTEQSWGQIKKKVIDILLYIEKQDFSIAKNLKVAEGS